MAEFLSWGGYPRVEGTTKSLHFRDEFWLGGAKERLAVGSGRSYGDLCLLHPGEMLRTTSLDRFLSFGAEAGLLCCEPGVTMEQILEFSVPRGWGLAVTPGTKSVTVGGAIASDVHGKNHGREGSFGLHIRNLQLSRSDGTSRTCSSTNNSDWFSATIGGMGLTGFIEWAEIQLRPLSSSKIVVEHTPFWGIQEALSLFRDSASEYRMAWVDTASRGREYARGVFMAGSHSYQATPPAWRTRKKFRVPCHLPRRVLCSRSAICFFNEIYFRLQGKPRSCIVELEPFYYLLDSLTDWNRLYVDGLLQFQCALPWSEAEAGIESILLEIAQSKISSPLMTLKAFGEGPSPGRISFPTPGVTAALDFPASAQNRETVGRLIDLTLQHGGRIYPAKDACMTPSQFAASFPHWHFLVAYKDPKINSNFWKRVTAQS